MKELKKLRNQIDQTDKKILALLSKRFEFTKKAGIIKKKQGIAIESKVREKEVLLFVRSESKRKNLNQKLIEKIYKLIFIQSKKEQITKK